MFCCVVGCPTSQSLALACDGPRTRVGTAAICFLPRRCRALSSRHCVLHWSPTCPIILDRRVDVLVVMQRQCSCDPDAAENKVFYSALRQWRRGNISQ